MELSKDELYTIENIYNLPDGQRAELIDGIIYNMSPPRRIHQKLVHYLDVTIGNYIGSNNGKCEVYPAPFAVFLNKDNKTYVEPDISIICDKEKLTDIGCNGSPEWIIEIVSPSSRQMDYYKKLLKYREAGVKEYWVVDPDKKVIIVYNFIEDEMYEFTFDDKVKSNILEDLVIDFSTFNFDL